MFNPKEERHIERLRKAIAASRKRLEPFRDHRLNALREYVGKNYSGDGSKDKVPVNYLELAVSIYVRQLAARQPRVLCKTSHVELKPRAAKFQMAMNHLLQEIRFHETLRKAAKNSMFSMGIVKCGLNTSSNSEIGGVLHDTGQPFADNVDLDDFFFDMCAKSWEQISFAGDRYRIPLDLIKEADIFDKDVRESMTKTNKYDRDEFYSNGEDKAEDLSGRKAEWQDEDEISDYAEVEDIWLPYYNLLITLPCDAKIKKPLRIVEWEGPEMGPYHRLYFDDVPNNIMPLPPVALWNDLHTLANSVFRKLGRQALRQKDMTYYSSSAKDAARRTQEADDGEMVECDNPGAIQTAKHGGIDQQSLMFSIQLRDIISYMFGNLDQAGGLAPQADTLGQEQLLAQAASKRVQDMQDAMGSFTKQLCRDCGFYLWNDPLIELPLVQQLKNTRHEVRDTFGPKDREGDFLAYNIDIQPYSMQDRTPQQRLQTVMTLVQQLLIPLAPQLEQSGAVINFEGILRVFAEYADMTELEDLVTFQAPNPNQQGPVQPPAASGKSPVTTRNYVRTNRPGASRAGKDLGMLQAMAGSAQPAEAAGAMRPMS